MTGFDSLAGNPWFNMGLNILAQNAPGVNAAQAIGRGGLGGLQSMAAFNDRKERAALRKLQAQQAQAQIDEFKRRAEQNLQLEKFKQQHLGQLPEELEGPVQDYGMPGSQPLMSEATGLRARDPQLAALMSTVPAEDYAKTMFGQQQSAQAGQLAQMKAMADLNKPFTASPGSWVIDRATGQVTHKIPTKKDAGLQVYRGPNGEFMLSQGGAGLSQFPQMSSGTKSSLEKEYSRLPSLSDQLKGLISDVKVNPRSVGVPADVNEIFSTIAGTFDAWFGTQMEPVVSDENITTIRSKAEILEQQLGPFLTGETSRFSDQERAMIKQRFKAARTATTQRQVVIALGNISDVIESRANEIRDQLRTGTVIQPSDDIQVSPKSKAILDELLGEK